MWLAALAALVVLLGGCTLTERRPFEVTLPAVDSIAALPVRLTDGSGTIKSMEIPFHPPARPLGMPADTFALPVSGRPEAVFVVWLGGLCDDQVDLEYTGLDTTFTITTARGHGGCQMAGVERSVVVVFRSPVDTSKFVVRDMS